MPRYQGQLLATEFDSAGFYRKSAYSLVQDVVESTQEDSRDFAAAEESPGCVALVDTRTQLFEYDLPLQT